MPTDSMVLFDASLRASAVLAGGWALTALIRRASAATRHFAWLCAIVLAALVPVATIVVPDWTVQAPRGFSDMAPTFAAPGVHPVEQHQEAAATPAHIPPTGERDSVSAPAVTARRLDLITVLVSAWAVGATAVVLYMLLGIAAVSRLRRSARPVTSAWIDEAQTLAEAFDAPSVAFMESTMTGMPIACGVWRPAILMPRAAGAWPAERLRVAVLHELAHIRRRDCLTQAVAQLVCALYWFNPLAWVAVRRLRAERERACDDFVLAAGTKGSEYATHLLDIARAPGTRFSILASAGVPMAHRSQLEGRLMAILDPAIRRSSAFYTRAAALTALVLISVPVAALQLRSAEAATPATQAQSPPRDVVRSAPVTVRAAVARTPDGTVLDDVILSVDARRRTLVAEGDLSPARQAAEPRPTSMAQGQPAPAPAFFIGDRRVQLERSRPSRALDRALLEAAEEGDVEGINDLIAAGADVNAPVDGDGSALIAAARRGRLDIVRKLLDRGADPNLGVGGDGSPLIMAARQGHVAIVELLLQRGADPNMGVEGDGNPIIMAARQGHAAVVELLLQRGANINEAVDGDENALIQASASGRLEMVKLLVSRGADVNARFLVRRSRVIQTETEVYDNLGRKRVLPVRRLDTREEWRSALSMARQGGHHAVVAFLISVGAQE
jgi:beta-lactamase regulating signal transducer with metallopeptidase domain